MKIALRKTFYLSKSKCFILFFRENKKKMFVKHLNLKQTKKTKLWSSSKLDILLDRLKSYFLIFFYMQEYIVWN